MIKQCKCKSGAFNPRCPLAKRQELAQNKDEIKAHKLLITELERWKHMVV